MMSTFKYKQEAYVQQCLLIMNASSKSIMYWKVDIVMVLQTLHK